MRIEIPVFSKFGPKVVRTTNGACSGSRKGKCNWSYDGRYVTGAGIFIAGAARSGTVYMTNLLKALGYEVGHEKVGQDGSVGYHLAYLEPKNCLHQVRHPLKQISSMLVHQAWGFMNSVIDIPGRGLLGCMTYWLEWNKLIEKFAIWRYRIEDLPDVWDEFLEKIGHGKCELPEVDKEGNSYANGSYLEKLRYQTLTWADFYKCNRELAQEIFNKSVEYGYYPKGQVMPPEVQDNLVA